MNFSYFSGGHTYSLVLEKQGSGYHASVEGKTIEVEIISEQEGVLVLRIGHNILTFYHAVDNGIRWISFQGCTYKLEKPRSRSSRPADSSAEFDSLRAPMPSKIRDILVAVDDEVEVGDTLMLLEAMKMEIRLQSPRRARVDSILVSVGQTVDRDELLIELRDKTSEGAS